MKSLALFGCLLLSLVFDNNERLERKGIKVSACAGNVKAHSSFGAASRGLDQIVEPCLVDNEALYQLLLSQLLRVEELLGNWAETLEIYEDHFRKDLTDWKQYRAWLRR